MSLFPRRMTMINICLLCFVFLFNINELIILELSIAVSVSLFQIIYCQFFSLGNSLPVRVSVTQE